MKLITAIVRPERVDAIKTALFAAEVTGLSISRVAGHGGEKTVLDMYRGQPLAYEFHEKVQLDVAVLRAVRRADHRCDRRSGKDRPGWRRQDLRPTAR